MMLKAIIIDDEKDSSDALKAMLEAAFPDVVQILKICNHADEGKECIGKLQPDLIFLDVEMPGKTGIDMLSEIPKISFEVIFTTAYEQYALPAIKFSALDYLLKPYTISELRTAIEKCTARIASKSSLQHDEKYRYQFLKSSGNKKLALNNGKLVEFIEISKIILVEAKRNYSEFTIEGQRKILVSKVLKEYEDMLEPHGFFRAHNSYLINLQHVKAVLSDQDFVRMQDNTEIPVSRRRKPDLMEALRNL